MARFFSFILTAGFVLVVAAGIALLTWGIHGFLYRSDYFMIRRVTIVEGLGEDASAEKEFPDHLLGDFEKTASLRRGGP